MCMHFMFIIIVEELSSSIVKSIKLATKYHLIVFIHLFLQLCVIFIGKYWTLWAIKQKQTGSITQTSTKWQFNDFQFAFHGSPFFYWSHLILSRVIWKCWTNTFSFRLKSQYVLVSFLFSSSRWLYYNTLN